MVGLPDDRERLAWWLFTLTMVGVIGFVLWAFVGTVVLGVFLYYGMRPIDRRLRDRLSFDTAADLTLLIALVPIVALVGYTIIVGISELSHLTGRPLSSFTRFVPGSPEQMTRLVGDLQQAVGPGPTQTERQEMISAVLSALGTLANALAHLLLALLLAFILLREDDRLAAWFTDQFASEGSAAHAYALSVDEDLHTVYVGNVLTVFAVIGLGIAVYTGLDLISPPNLGVPVPALLALLTGLATLVPLVVGKLVYLPVGLYLGYRAVTGPAELWFPAVFVVVCFVLLDLLPVAVLRPYIAGRNIHGGLMVFAYVGGTMLFGWYGLFLGPLLVVLSVQLARIVVPELVHGETVTRQVRTAEALGTDPDSVKAERQDDG